MARESFLFLLILNLLVETGFAVCLIPFLRRLQGDGFRVLSFLPCCVMINLMTHPLAFLAVENQVASFALVETMVLVVETISYRLILDFRWRAAGAMASITNAASLLLGILM